MISIFHARSDNPFAIRTECYLLLTINPVEEKMTFFHAWQPKSARNLAKVLERQPTST